MGKKQVVEINFLYYMSYWYVESTQSYSWSPSRGVEDSKYIASINCGQHGKRSELGITYWKPISVFADMPLCLFQTHESQHWLSTLWTLNTSLDAWMWPMYEYIIQNTNKSSPITPNNSTLLPIQLPFNVPEQYPPPTLVLEQLWCQCIPSSQWPICHLAATSIVPFGQSDCNWRIHNVIVLAYPSHIHISYIIFFIIGQESKSTVVDDSKLSLLADIPSMMLPCIISQASFRHWPPALIWVLYLSIIIGIFPNISQYIFHTRWKRIIQSKDPVAVMHRHLGSGCTVVLLAPINETTKHWVA